MARTSTKKKPLAAVKKAHAPIDFVEIGGTGLREHGGRIHEEFLPKLRGRHGIRVFQEMSLNDPVVAAFLFTIRNLLLQTQIDVTPTGDTPQHLAEADFLEETIEDMSITFHDFISETLSMLEFGWAWFEIVWKARRGDTPPEVDGIAPASSQFKDNRIGVSKLAIRSQDSLDRWQFDETGSLTGAWFIAHRTHTARFIPIEKSIHFKTESTKANPEGRSFLRGAYRPWFFKKRFEEVRGIAVHSDLVGVPHFKVPPELLVANPSPEDRATRNAIEDIGQQLVTGNRSVLVTPHTLDSDGDPTGYEFELIKGGGRPKIDVDAAIRYSDSRILTAVASQFLLLGQEKTGSFALADSQTNLFGYMMGSILDNIVETLNHKLVAELFSINGVPREFWPKFTHGDIESPDLDVVSKYVTSLVDSGVIVPGPELEKHMREVGNLPLPEPLGGGEVFPDPIAVDRMVTDGKITPETAAALAELTGEAGLAKPPTILSGTDPSASAEEEKPLFTGIQITSMINIINAVATRQLPREIGLELLKTALNLDAATAENVMGVVGKTFFLDAPEE